MDRVTLLNMLTGLHLGRCLVIPTCSGQTPAGSWVPGALSFQLVLHGQIPTTAWCDAQETLLRSGDLICCAAGAASTRRYDVAREHLALGREHGQLRIRHYRRAADDPPAQARQEYMDLPLSPLISSLLDLLQRGFEARVARSQQSHLALHLPRLLLHELQRPEQVLLERARSWLHQHFADDMDRGDLAEWLGCHPDHVSRLFRAADSSFAAERRRLRCEHACSLLQQEDLALTVIAAACGFNSETYLIRCFRQVYGCSPGRWRQQQQPPV